MPEEEFELTVNGQRHGGWKDSDLRLSIEQLAHTFKVGFADRWQEKGEPFPIRRYDKVQVDIAGEKVLTGTVKRFSSSGKRGQRALSVTGASKTQKLVDCSDVIPAYTGLTFQQIAEEFCSRFDIKVVVEDERVLADPDFAKPIEAFVADFGETYFAALSRLAALRGVLLTTNADGDLEIVRAGQARVVDTVLRYGENILEYEYSEEETFSKYTYHSQMACKPQWSGRQASTITTTVLDENVEDYRPTTGFVREPCDFAQLEKKAKFDRNVRAAQSEKFTYTVQGWRHAPQRSGALALVDTQLGLRAPAGIWRPNYLVRVIHPEIGLDDYLLIHTVDFRRGGKDAKLGRRTVLSMTAPEAYDVLKEPLPRAKRRKRKGKGELSELDKAAKRYADSRARGDG